eukprot:TRINITY_DN5846_c0_g2_i1.p1 TRINITY_DN5846_c0_g2~~TRINITY_DN5846_c0_g2_i1.p1  ORF type:complete len:410 (+),score=103.37 TRINITY_DN5846_c0_g2_i1:186-1415(+)
MTNKNFLASALGLNTYKRPVIKVGSQRVSLDFIRHSPNAKTPHSNTSPFKKSESNTGNRNDRGMIQQLRSTNKTPSARSFIKQEEDIQCSPFVPQYRKRPLDEIDSPSPKSTKQQNPPNTDSNVQSSEKQQRTPNIRPHSTPVTKEEPSFGHPSVYIPDSNCLYSPDQNKKSFSTNTTPTHSPSPDHTQNNHDLENEKFDEHVFGETMDKTGLAKDTRRTVVGVGDSQISDSPIILNFEFKNGIIDDTASSKHDRASVKEVEDQQKVISEEPPRAVNLNSQILKEDFEIFESQPPSVGQPLLPLPNNNNTFSHSNDMHIEHQSNTGPPHTSSKRPTTSTKLSPPPSCEIEEDDQDLPSPFLKRKYDLESKAKQPNTAQQQHHPYFIEEEEETGSFISSLEKFMMKIETS